MCSAVEVEYSLTEFGRSLEPVLLAMCDWGKQYMILALKRELLSETAQSVPQMPRSGDAVEA